MTTHHSTNGVIVFSVLMLIVFGTIAAVLSYLDLYLAAYIAQNLTARLRNQLFEHLQRLSLDWHGKQKKGDLVQRVTGNIADIEKLVTDGLVDLLAAVLTLAGIVAVMLFLSSAYTVIALTIVPALFMITLGLYQEHQGRNEEGVESDRPGFGCSDRRHQRAHRHQGIHARGEGSAALWRLRR